MMTPQYFIFHWSYPITACIHGELGKTGRESAFTTPLYKWLIWGWAVQWLCLVGIGIPNCPVPNTALIHMHFTSSCLQLAGSVLRQYQVFLSRSRSFSREAALITASPPFSLLFQSAKDHPAMREGRGKEFRAIHRGDKHQGEGRAIKAKGQCWHKNKWIQTSHE